MHNASTYTGDLQVNSRCMPVIASIAGYSFHFGGGKSAVMRFEKMLQFLFLITTKGIQYGYESLQRLL